MKINANINIESILISNIPTIQKYWILHGLIKMTNADSDEEELVCSLVTSLHYAIEEERNNK